jgi:hypothetical protein
MARRAVRRAPRFPIIGKRGVVFSRPWKIFSRERAQNRRGSNPWKKRQKRFQTLEESRRKKAQKSQKFPSIRVCEARGEQPFLRLKIIIPVWLLKMILPSSFFHFVISHSRSVGINFPNLGKFHPVFSKGWKNLLSRCNRTGLCGHCSGVGRKRTEAEEVEDQNQCVHLI